MTKIERRPLGRTGVTVPSLCLGTMMYGDQISEADAARQMDRCFERGIDFFDTAEMYTIPPKAETQGESERIVGRWIKDRGARDKIMLATKIAGRSTNPYLRGGQDARVRYQDMVMAIERSLTNLQTDYIDLYQIHWPDREVPIFGNALHGYTHNPNKDAVPIQEQLEGLAKLVEQGKVRYLGLSNETPWGVMQFLKYADEMDLPRIVSIQNAYNLLNRTYEYGLAEIGMNEDVGLLAYSPIGQGALTGKYLGGVKPEGSRGAMFGRLGRYETPSAEKAIKAYVDLARELSVDPAALAMQFVTSRPWVASNIFGARTDEQLDTIFQSLEIEMTQEIMEKINAIHAACPNPCP